MTAKLKRLMGQYAIIFVLFALIAVFSIMAPTFSSVINAMNIVRQISMMSIITVGFTFVMIGGGLDLSVGSQIAIMNIGVSYLIVNFGVNPVVAVVLGLILTTAIGFFNGYIISKTNIPPLIATLAMMTAMRGLTFIISQGYPIYGIPAGMKVIGQGNLFNIIPVPGLIMIVVIALGSFLLNKTYLGRHFYALGSNTEATRLAGINVHKTRIITYTLLGFLTGVAGLIMLCRTGSGQPNIAEGMEMDVLTAAVLGGVSVNGGKGNVSGAIIGAAIIGVLNNGMSIVGANDYYQQVITGVVLLIVVVFDGMSRTKKKVKA